MNASEKDIWNRITRYVSGNSSDKERRVLEEWMHSRSENEAMVERAREVWQSTPEEDFEVNTEEAWNRFSARIRRDYSSKNDKQPSAKTIDRKLFLYRLAAGILLAALVTFFSWNYFHTQASRDADNAMKTVATKKGEKFKVIFSDGTAMMLNAESSLRFPKKFRHSKREVFLRGEAYFDVVHATARPFIVHTPEADIQVMGTKFNVSARKESSESVVGVREGMVSVFATGTSGPDTPPHQLVEAGQAVTVKNHHVSAPQAMNVANLTLWTSGGIYFNDEPFEDVAHKIERTFDVKVKIKNKKLKNVHFTSAFKNASLDEVLTVVSTSMGIKYAKNDSSIVFW